MGIKFNPFTSNFDFTGEGSSSVDTSFGWTLIPVGTTVLVPVNRVMFYFSPFIVEGNLMVDGFLKEVA